MLRRGKHSKQAKEAIREAERIIPPSGDTRDLLELLSQMRNRPIRVLVEPMSESMSGALLCTEEADYIAVSEGSSPERQVSVVCHEAAHALLGHDHTESTSSSLVEPGLLHGLSPDLVRSVVAGRRAYAHSVESDAELVATFISTELRKRVMRGGHTHFDDRWQ